jgi:cholest-4-en-3-one 26-monooxygenase
MRRDEEIQDMSPTKGLERLSESNLPDLITDVGIYEDGRALEVFEFLREHAPIIRHPDPLHPGEEFWAVTGWQESVDVYLNAKTFTNHIYDRPKDGRRWGGVMFDTWPSDHTIGMRYMLQHRNDPEHRDYKKVVAKHFREQQIDRLRDRMREVARDTIAQHLERGECDFVADIAHHIPARILLEEMIGVPPEMRREAQQLTAACFGFGDEELGTSIPSVEALHGKFRRLILDLAQERRRHPQDDILTVAATAEVDGERIEGDDLFELIMGMVLAGYDTTVDAIGLGMARLLESPEELRRLRADRSLLPTTVEEILRLDCPVLTDRRTASVDTELHGHQIKAHDKVVIFNLSANYDGRQFADPYTFNLARKPNRHLTLGWGLHHCLGAWLSKAEIMTVLDETLSSMENIELAGEVRRIKSMWMQGLKRLPIRFTPSARRH